MSVAVLAVMSLITSSSPWSAAQTPMAPELPRFPAVDRFPAQAAGSARSRACSGPDESRTAFAPQAATPAAFDDPATRASGARAAVMPDASRHAGPRSPRMERRVLVVDAHGTRSCATSGPTHVELALANGWAGPVVNGPIQYVRWLTQQRFRCAGARLPPAAAGATVSALTAALLLYIPTLEDQAKAVVRNVEAKWRPNLLPAAVGYAVAFSTQAVERDRHRKPVHVVDSTSDGLSQISKPFAVTGDSVNVEGGLQALLEYLLLPLLLGHGLSDEPREPHRSYGAADNDARPPRKPQDAYLSHEIDRAAQIAVVLGMHWSGASTSDAPWEGQRDPTLETSRLDSTKPVNDAIAAVREEARLHAAGTAFDHGGAVTMVADEAWARTGWWIPADDAPHAVRHARDFLIKDLRVDVLWAGLRCRSQIASSRINAGRCVQIRHKTGSNDSVRLSGSAARTNSARCTPLAWTARHCLTCTTHKSWCCVRGRSHSATTQCHG